MERMERNERNEIETAKKVAAGVEDAHFTSHLNESDALLWSIERDPCLRSTIVAVSLLDSCPDFQRLSDRLADACRQVPRLRQKVATIPLHLGAPRWQFDEQFDLDYHLRRVVVPSPSDFRAVLDMAAPMAMAAFDKDRPLWEFTVVEGVEGGRAAFIQKVHHSFTDGVGGVTLAQMLLDDSPNPPKQDAARDMLERRIVSGLRSTLESMVSDVRMATDFSWRGATALPGRTVSALLHPTRLVDQTVSALASIAKLLAPVTKPLSPVMRRRGLSRRLDAFDVPFGALLTAAHAADSSLNDAFLASVAGGLRRYHENHSLPTDGLRVTMPINVRRADDPLGNNRFVPARMVIPVSTVDPVERMRQLGALALAWRNEPALSFSDAIAGALNRLPVSVTTSIFGGMLKAIDLVVTNVPGIRRRVYLAGAEVIREYAFAPPSGAALSVALLSHRDHCCIGVNIDTRAVPDAEELIACLREGFDEVLAVGSPHTNDDGEARTGNLGDEESHDKADGARSTAVPGPASGRSRHRAVRSGQ